jgi:hypothetical protein
MKWSKKETPKGAIIYLYLDKKIIVSLVKQLQDLDADEPLMSISLDNDLEVK